jgi:membrane protein DedA with SNARE-associated domain
MKKALIIASLLGSLWILLDSVSAAHWFILFILVGVIPGTNIVISPIDMLAAISTAITVIVLRITTWPSIRTYLERSIQSGTSSSADVQPQTI